MAEIDDSSAYFDKAVALVASGAFNASDDDKLKLYGFFKQATVGKCNTSRPGFFDFVGKSKWFVFRCVGFFPDHLRNRDAWNKLGTMEAEEAKIAYVQTADALAPGWRVRFLSFAWIFVHFADSLELRMVWRSP